MEKETIKKPIELAGEERCNDADENMPTEQKDSCSHEFRLEKTILKKKTLFTNQETLSAVVYCKKCGWLGGSSRIRA